MKKKIISLCLTVALAAVGVTGATLAYFTDTDSATNVFTVGNIDISLTENFEQNSLLMPVTGSAQNGTLKNGVKKEVYVNTEEGSQPAYVRVQIAIPDVLDDGASTFDAGKNVLHFNYSGNADYNWNWKTNADGTGNWNYYEKTIDGIDYNVYVVTYNDILEAGDTTAYPAMNQVYLDKNVTSSDAAKINEELGSNWKILVAAQGTQVAGFEDPYTALNTAFGTPTADNSPFADTAASE